MQNNFFNFALSINLDLFELNKTFEHLNSQICSNQNIGIKTMKKISVLTAFFCLFLATSAVFAQNKAANFAGLWELDVAKSKIPERMRVESMTLNVSQTDKEIKVETNSKRAARPEGDRPAGDVNSGGMRRGGGMMGRAGGRMMGGNGTVTYSLTARETILEVEQAPGTPPESLTLKANLEKDGKLKLSSSRNFEMPNGAMTTKTSETWELTDGGKSLKIMREMETPRGTQSSEMYFTKKSEVKSDKTKTSSM